VTYKTRDMTRERSVRMYANHLGLMVRGSAGAFKLVERYGKKQEIGTYSSVDTLERGIERYGERMMHEDYVVPAQKLMHQGLKAKGK
jgi:hypothetical protein